MKSARGTYDLRMMELLAAGFFRIDSSGYIWRLLESKGRTLGGVVHYRIPPRRAEVAITKGYLRVNACRDGRRIGSMAHRMVWMQANGPIPDALTINHKNGIRDDNRLSNLELMTPSEQLQHAYDVLGFEAVRGVANPNSKLTEATAAAIRSLRGTATHQSLAAQFGVSRSTIQAIQSGQAWKWM